MNSESISIESLREKCAKRFAAWLTGLPELSEWEERKPLVQELNRIEARLEQEGRGIYPFLPSLLKPTRSVTQEVAAWTEAAMKALNVMPDWSGEQSPLEKVQDLVNLLSDAAIPLDREFR